ncbi:unnamed protein product [Thelazia callipaeda]|uniref:Uncharacterized protein n=1 Tax=Thelazia callipaeda TaxID=103827 RepID=A0A0N5CRL7_THECL|nr:unnamed protein product [Thelazia callipaeda]
MLFAALESFTTNSVVAQENSINELFKIPLTHHLLPILLMIVVLLTLLLACFYDCKVNRDCYRTSSGSVSANTADKTGIYLYDGETGESRTCSAK